ncbi:MAG: branched-chain amino acid ABC transporter permease [Burkholderiales bacterium]
MKRAESAAVAVLVAVALAAPLFLEGFRLFQLSSALVYAISLLGLNLLIGFSGQISLGHGAFMALGAYASALLMLKLGFPYWTAIPLAALICLLVGLLIGLPALRFEGHYLALCTFALAVAAPQLLKAKVLEPFTGGVGGFVLKKPSVPAGLPISQDAWLYGLSLLLFLASSLFVRNLVSGRIGRALVALRDHPSAAMCMGVDIARFKTIVFGLAAFFAGLAGAMGAVLIQFVSPDSYSIMLSISLLVGVVVGGLGSPAGAIYGALFIQFVPNLAESFSKSAPWAIYAVFVIAVAIALPTGMAGLVKMLFATRAVRPGGSMD